MVISTLSTEGWRGEFSDWGDRGTAASICLIGARALGVSDVQVATGRGIGVATGCSKFERYLGPCPGGRGVRRARKGMSPG